MRLHKRRVGLMRVKRLMEEDSIVIKIMCRVVKLLHHLLLHHHHHHHLIIIIKMVDCLIIVSWQ